MYVIVMCFNALCHQVCSSDLTFHTICSVRLPHAEDFAGWCFVFLICCKFADICCLIIHLYVFWLVVSRVCDVFF